MQLPWPVPWRWGNVKAMLQNIWDSMKCGSYKTSSVFCLGLDTDSLQAIRETALFLSWDEELLTQGGGKKEIQLGSCSLAKVRGLHAVLRRDVYTVHTLLTFWLINLCYLCRGCWWDYLHVTAGEGNGFLKRRSSSTLLESTQGWHQESESGRAFLWGGVTKWHKRMWCSWCRLAEG